MTREMKDSGIEWVGNIPQDWEVSPLYIYFKERKNKNKEDQENNLLSLSYGKIVRKPIDILEGLLPESFSTYNIVEKGDIIIRPTDLQNDKKSLRTGLVQEHGIITSAYIDLYLTGIGDVRYYHYLLHAFDEAKVFYNMGNGVRQGLNYSTFSKLPILTPPLAAQSNIANYLDYRCSQIDQLTDNIKQQIASLGEYKKALITQAVTKGLDPDVEMKDSGIEWIEEIPVTWVIKKLNAFYSRIAIKSHPNERVLSVYREYGVIPKDSRSDNHNVTSENASAYLLVRPTNLVVNKMKAWQGSMGISNHKGIVSPAYFVYQETALPRERRFFHYLLRSNIYAQEFRRLSSGMREGQWDLPAYDFERTPIIIPPLLEQQQIAAFLDTQCFQIDALIQTKNETLNILQEHKKSLIFDYVTGKREVPGLYRKDGCHE
ncbi:MAG: restriction endonuclease subunit S [Allobaculum sp.]